VSLTPEQFAIRKTGITATDITRIVGESPFGGPCDVYYDKVTDEPPRPSTLVQRMGNFLEPLVLELIAEHFRITVNPGGTVRHPIYPWVIATPDGVTAPNGCAEAKVKSVLFTGREQWMDDEAPPPFVHVQCQWQCIAQRTPVCYAGALIGATPRFWLVESDEDLAAALLEAGQEFHERHVVPRIPPAPDGTEGARKMLAAIWPKAKGATIKASPEAEEAARAYFEASKSLKVVEAAKEQAAQDLIAYAQDFERVEGDGWRLLLAERPAVHIEAYDKKAYRHFDLRPSKGRAA
jgi:putative phage-type endonuclease